MKGFTLIETLLYLALLSFLILGAVTSLYSIEGVVGGEHAAVTTENEGSFVLSKIAWVVSNADAITAPISGTEHALSVRAAGVTTHITIVDGVVYLKEGSADAMPLTSTNVRVEDFSVTPLTGNGVHVSFRISNTPFETRAYLRP